jgi:predicted DNA-binding protein (MmcQ/YjbR family)
MKWIQSHDRGLSKAELKLYLKGSHGLVAAGLSKKKRTELVCRRLLRSELVSQ